MNPRRLLPSQLEMSMVDPRTALSIRRWLAVVSGAGVSCCVYAQRCKSALCDMTYSSVPKFNVKVAKVRLGDVENGFPGVEAFGHEHLGVLGKTQSRQAFFQFAAHVEEPKRVAPR
jgi:hypothetical protein